MLLEWGISGAVSVATVDELPKVTAPFNVAVPSTVNDVKVLVSVINVPMFAVVMMVPPASGKVISRAEDGPTRPTLFTKDPNWNTRGAVVP